MNKTVLVGRLTADPNVRVSAGENPLTIARYTLAVDRKFKRDGEPTADFISCVAMGKNGEFAEKYLRKGTKIGVIGHIQTGKYEKDGTTVYTTDVMVEEHEFVESKSSQSSNQNDDMPMDDDGFVDIPLDAIGDELPFK